jgi:hypothetical protein
LATALTSIAVVERKELVAGRKKLAGGLTAVVESSLASLGAAMVVAAVRQNTWLPRAANENMIDRHLL